ncbi:MAG: hypothetical protein WCG19_03530 [Chlorobiaceae bacterium]
MKIIKEIRAIKNTYYQRMVIKKIISTSNSIKVVLGAGKSKYNEWIATDYPLLDVVNEKSWMRLFKPGAIDALLAEHVFEHLTDYEITLAFSNIYKFLKINGYIRIAVPDGYHSSNDYIEMIKPGGYGAGSDDHKQLFNYKTLSKKLLDAGFSLNLLEWFDEHRQFNYRSWTEEDGFISRSSCNDKRNIGNSFAYTSLIIDAKKQ